VNGGPAADRRVLALAPTGKDASMTAVVLSQAGIAHEICAAFEILVHQLGAGAAAVLLPEEVLTPPNLALLSEVLESQPPWSDLPILVLTRPGADSDESGRAARTLGNVTLLERPLRVATLLSAIRTAVRARARQYEIRAHLEERERAAQSLREADRRKDEFLAVLGHELRNPLAPLVSGLQLLQLEQARDPLVLRVHAAMERQIHHLVRLVDDLLEVSRITRGLIQLHRQPLDLAWVLGSAVETCRPGVEAAGHELVVDLPNGPLTVVGDEVRLTQVFSNLLSNATKYTDPGGHIRVTARREADRVVVSIRDDGIGIPPSHLASVFEMFAQVDRSHQRSQGGLGIGLTLTRTLVTMHDGRVEARSQGLGTGSEFLVDLPLLVGTTAVETERTGARRTFPPRRILVVDDNLDAAEMLRALLTALGATVSKAHSGRAALEVLDSFKPDAVVLDIAMPEMDGYEVARRIRGMPAHRGVLLVALSGWGQEHDQRRSLEAGFDHHFVKPLDADRLGDLLWSDRGEIREDARPSPVGPRLPTSHQ
jgi:signal transduction histidine kinase/ActR/RegA family two-component response regulator